MMINASKDFKQLRKHPQMPQFTPSTLCESCACDKEVATGEKRNIPPQKATAWELAKNYARIDPYQLADMPQMLTDAMLKQKK